MKIIVKVIAIVFIAIYFACLSGCSERQKPAAVTENEVMEEPDRFAEVIANMTLRQKISSLIIVGLDETAINDQVRQRFSEYPFGGIILFERNYIREDWLIDFIAELKSISAHDYPLLVCIDEEGGAVSRLPELSFPSAAKMSEMSEEEVFAIGEAVADQLLLIGINMNLAPVLDVNVNPGNKVIGSRSFGTDPEVVSAYGIAFFKGLEAGKMLAVGKHYPGHGSTAVDSHYELPILDKTVEELAIFELIPFMNAVQAGIPVIMTAHLVVSGIDDRPATMSKPLIELLRGDLGFEGVIISDDLMMGALTDNYSWSEIVVGTFMAGVDLLLIGSDIEKQMEAVHLLESAYQEGLITNERLDSSLRRIMKLQVTF
jgi:beta-N-acetylhexosaminidase